MNRNVQSLRGFACILLVFYHVVGNTPQTGLKVTSGSMRLLIDGLAMLRMPLFALIAGAVYAQHPRYGMSMITGKFKRLMVPMLTVGTLFAITQALIPGTNMQTENWMLLHIIPVGHFWFLESLFLIFCGISLLERAHLLETVPSWVAVFLISAVTYLMNFGVLWFGIAGMFYLIPYFLAGLAIERFQWKSSNPLIAILMLVACVIILILWAPPATWTDRRLPASLAIGLLSSSALWLQPIRGAWLAKIGDYSYSIFLFHVFFTAATRILLTRLGIESIAIHISAGLIAGLLGSAGLQHILMRSKNLRFLMLGISQKPKNQYVHRKPAHAGSTS